MTRAAHLESMGAKRQDDAVAPGGDSPSGAAHGDVPIGNTPWAPRWPLAASGLAWLAGLAFMVLMVVTRTCSLPL